MKRFTICLVMAVLAMVTYSQNNYGGYKTLTVKGNDSPGACLLTLSYTLSSNAIDFTETVSNPNQDCTYQNLTFQSMFNEDPLNGQITLVKDAVDPNKYTGTMTMADFAANNGTACVNFVPFGSFDYWYLCRFKYGSVLFQFLFLANPSTGVILTNSDWLLFPVYGATVLVSQNNTVVWKFSNQSFPQFVGMLYNQCGGWSTSIPSASNEVYVTGTELQSNQLNLHNYFNGFLLYSAIIKKKGAPANQYISSWIYNNALSNPTVSGNCSDFLVTYGSLLPDMNYCKNGCDVSFLMYTGSVSFYMLRTSGFTYAGSLRG